MRPFYCLVHFFEHKITNGTIAATKASGIGSRLRKRVQAITVCVLLIAKIFDFLEVFRSFANKFFTQNNLHNAILPGVLIDSFVIVIKRIHDTHSKPFSRSMRYMYSSIRIYVLEENFIYVMKYRRIIVFVNKICRLQTNLFEVGGIYV